MCFKNSAYKNKILFNELLLVLKYSSVPLAKYTEARRFNQYTRINKNPPIAQGDLNIILKVQSHTFRFSLKLKLLKAAEIEITFYLCVLIAVRTVYCVLTH